MKIQLIKRFQTTPTQYGTKTGWKIVSGANEMFADCFNCPSDWNEGEVKEIESLAEREYNGKTYYTIKLPKVKKDDVFSEINAVSQITHSYESKNTVSQTELNIIKLEQSIARITFMCKSLCEQFGLPIDEPKKEVITNGRVYKDSEIPF